MSPMHRGQGPHEIGCSMPCSIVWSHSSGAKAPQSPGILHSVMGTGQRPGGWRKAGDGDSMELLQSEP